MTLEPIAKEKQNQQKNAGICLGGIGLYSNHAMICQSGDRPLCGGGRCQPAGRFLKADPPLRNPLIDETKSLMSATCRVTPSRFDNVASLQANLQNP